METLEKVLLKASEQVPGLVIFALFAGLTVVGILKHLRFWTEDLKRIVDQSNSLHKELHDRHQADRETMHEVIHINTLAIGGNTEVLRSFSNGRYSK